ncbi:hypothetical protein [Tellurirhabdus bombi]|uniref:hypothetical protein n=1 Tax=Tellurirhabdus bombi TaxID=2907205 RepID=UPI001F26C444|nr:hypothetical protein [Tellurirhabdus bombi]
MEQSQTPKVNTCPEFPFFNASYPDATCINGFLWDLDSYEDGGLTQGGEDPCPFCNTEEHIKHMLDPKEGYTRKYILSSIEKLKEIYGGK